MISGNQQHGVEILGDTTSGTVVAGNYIVGNALAGVYIHDGASKNRIGADGADVDAAAEGNVLSGNLWLGVAIMDTGTQSNVVAGNLIGTDATGRNALGNAAGGILIARGATNTRIGTNGDGAGDVLERNVISSSPSFGVWISDVGTTGNVVAGNYIGTDVTGRVALGNASAGVFIVNGASNNRIGADGRDIDAAAEGNVISGNGWIGVGILDPGTNGNVVAGNLIGTDATGKKALANAWIGIQVWNGATNTLIGTNADGEGDMLERNVIASCPSSFGVWISDVGTAGSVVAGNFIGTDVTGTAAVGNALAGIAVVRGATNTRIGTNGDGAGDAAERNVISGNQSDGIEIADPGTAGTIVAGNYIGTDVTGHIALGNAADGVRIFDGAINTRVGVHGGDVDAAGEVNVISGNQSDGIEIADAGTNGTIVAGNYIGTDATGNSPLGNGATGILIDGGAASNVVGGTMPGQANIIAFNHGSGVVISGIASSGNSIRGNTIYLNAGLGIDLGADGVTPNDANDADAGPNGLQNFPALTLAEAGASTHVEGAFQGAANATLIIDVYSNTVGDPSGYGQGRNYLGSTAVTTDGTGYAVVNVTLAAATNVGDVISATATDAAGNTSEFSADLTTVADAPLSDTTPVTTLNGTEGLANSNAVVMTFTDVDPFASAGEFSISSLSWGSVLSGPAPTVSILTDPSYSGSGSGWEVVADVVTYSESGSHTVSLTAHDANGSDVSTSNVSFDVADIPPTAHITSPSVAGDIVGFTLMASDPSAADPAAGFSYTIDWGDGTNLNPGVQVVAATANNGAGALVSHAFATPGEYIVQTTAQDIDGGISSTVSALVVVSAATGETVNISGAGSPGQVAVSSNDPLVPTATFSPADLVVVAGTGGADTYTVNFDSGLTVPIAVAGSGSDTLSVVGSSDPNTNNYMVKNPGGSSTVTWAGSAGPPTETVTYSGIGSINVFGGAGSNFITDPGTATRIYGGPGFNTITITAAVGSGVVINGGRSSNTYIINLGSLAGPVAINNTNPSASDSLIVNGAADNNVIVAAANQVTAGNQKITIVAPLANLAINTGNGDNQVTVSSLDNNVQTLAINGGSGNNVVTLADVGASVGSVAVDGGTGTTQLQVTGEQPPAFVPQNVVLATTTSVVSSQPAVYGQSVTFTATVAATLAGAGTPTGTVQFIVDGANYGATETMSGGTATFSLSTLSAGPHTIAAQYLSDSSLFLNSPSDPNFTVNVTPAPLTITANDETMVYGGALPALTVTYSGLTNGDTSATFSTSPNVAPSVTAPATNHVGRYAGAIVASGAVDTNYSISYVAGTLKVTPAALLVTANDQTMAYGGALPTLTVTYTGLANGDTPSTFATSPNVAPSVTAPPTNHVGSYAGAIVASGAVDPDYSISYAAGTLKVTTAALAITANNQTMVYGGALPALTVTYTGLTNGDTPATFSTSPNVAPSVTAPATNHVGSYVGAIVASGAVDPDYSISYAAGTLKVTPAALTITANNQPMVYGGALPPLTVTYTGLTNGDTPATFSTSPNVAPSVTASATNHVGSYVGAIVASGAVDADYSISYASGTLKVTPATLTVTANNTSRIYLAANPTFTDKITGFVNGDTSGVVSGAASLTTPATTASPVGTYPINVAQGPLSAADYTFSFVNGTLTVSAADSIYVLNSSASGALTVASGSGISIAGSLEVDSTSASALQASGNATIKATSIQIVGGYSVSGNASVSPKPTTGAAPVADPLASLPSPMTAGLTNYGSLSLSGSSSATIQPGIYSQISVSGNASLTMNPGVYIIEGGGMTVSGKANASGTGVLIFNAGSGYSNNSGTATDGGNFGGMTFSSKGTCNLSAATTGTYAGILIDQARDNTRALSLGGNSRAGISGTIYAANALVSISNTQLAGSLVAGTLNFSGNVALTQMAAGSDGAGDVATIADTLLAGNLYVYVDNSNGGFSPDELVRVQDAISGWNTLLVAYSVSVVQVSDRSLANIVIDTGTTSASGDAGDGVLGCYNSGATEMTLLQGWNWYAGADASQIGGDQYDFQTTVTHEIGHALGLGGATDPNSPMYESLAAGVAHRLPNASDLNIPEPPEGADPQMAAGFADPDNAAGPQQPSDVFDSASGIGLPAALSPSARPFTGPEPSGSDFDVAVTPVAFVRQDDGTSQPEAAHNQVWAAWNDELD